MKSFTSFSRVGRFGALYFSRLGSRAHHCLQLQCIFFPLFHYQASTKYLVLEETGNTPAKFFQYPYLRCKPPSPCIIHLSLDFPFCSLLIQQYTLLSQQITTAKSTLASPLLTSHHPLSNRTRQNHFKLTISNPKDQDNQVCASQHSTSRICQVALNKSVLQFHMTVFTSVQHKLTDILQQCPYQVIREHDLPSLERWSHTHGPRIQKVEPFQPKSERCIIT